MLAIDIAGPVNMVGHFSSKVFFWGLCPTWSHSGKAENGLYNIWSKNKQTHFTVLGHSTLELGQVQLKFYEVNSLKILIILFLLLLLDIQLLFVVKCDSYMYALVLSLFWQKYCMLCRNLLEK